MAAAGSPALGTRHVFTVELDLTDGRSHRVAFYMLDWDDNARVQSVSVTDAATGQKLAADQTVSGFSGGRYLVYELSGRVRVTFMRLAGYNAVLGGVFFDEQAPPAGAPAVVGPALRPGHRLAADSRLARQSRLATLFSGSRIGLGADQIL